MDQAHFLNTIVQLTEAHVNGAVSGEEFVRQYDDLMADELPDLIKPEFLRLLDLYHLDCAMYQPDPKLRGGVEGLYGDEELQKKSRQFLEDLHSMDA